MSPGERAALFYHRLDEACGVAAEVLKDGIRQGEMCRFMFRVPQDVMMERMRAHGLDLNAQPSVETVPLFHALTDGLSGPSAGEQLRSFVQRSRGSGFAGARLVLNVPEPLAAQEASKSEWQEMEEVREELGVTMVCLYDMTSLSPGFLLRSLASYPQVIIDGVLCRNFYYVPSLEYPQRDAYRDLCDQLESIREAKALQESEGKERSHLIDLNRELQEEMMHRRMVEFALLRAENNLRAMLDAMPEPVFMVDRDLRVTLGNLMFVRHLEDAGVGAAYEGRYVYDLLPGAPTGGRSLFEEVFRYGHPALVEGSMTTDLGRLDTEVRLVPVMMGDKVDRVVAIVRPKRASVRGMREMWDRSDALRQELLDPAGPAAGSMERCPHPVLVTDRGGRLIRFNQALVREIGGTSDNVAGIGSAYGFLSPQRSADGSVRRISIDGRISIPSVLTRRDGSKREVMCYVVYIGEGDGAMILTVIAPAE